MANGYWMTASFSTIMPQELHLLWQEPRLEQVQPTKLEHMIRKAIILTEVKPIRLPFPAPSLPKTSGRLLCMIARHAGVDSNSPDIKPNADGSYTVWFSSEPPKGKEGNWVQTMPGKSFNCLLRLYGPLEPFFDKTWMPGDFELVK